MTRATRGIVLASICILLAGLAFLAFLGFYNRYWADDWCYNRDFNHLGLARTMAMYLGIGFQPGRGYSPNRYSLTLMSGLLYKLGIFGTQVLGLLVIAGWVASLGWLLGRVNSLRGHYPRAVPWLASCLPVFYCLYISPQRFEVLYWRSGAHYSVTIIGALLMLALIARQAGREQRSVTVSVIIFVLGLLTGGLSETGAAWLFTGLALSWAAVWIARRRGATWAGAAFEPASAALLGAAAAVAALALSPTNSRVERLNTETTPWQLVLPLSLRYAVDFIRESLQGLPLPHLMFAVACGALALLVHPHRTDENEKRRASRALLWLAGTAITVIVLIAAVQAPTVRFYSSPAAPRAESIAQFTMLAGIAVAAWVIAGFIRQRWSSQWITALALVGLIAAMLYSARLVALAYQELGGYQQRAARWDQRDAYIRAGVASGQRRMAVPVIDTHDIGVRDLLRSVDTAGQWVDNCGAQYYGLDAISAQQP